VSERRWEIDVRVDSLGTPRIVYLGLIRGPSWPQWSDFERVEIERPGEGGGPVGEIRINTTKITRVREQCVEAIPDRRYSYVMLEGLPLRDYRAEVDIEPEAQGCSIRWRATYFYEGLPGTAWLFHLVLRAFIARTARQLAEVAADA
jgi:hypothetical protein